MCIPDGGCQFCKCGHLAISLDSGAWGHEFENPETGIVWFESCDNRNGPHYQMSYTEKALDAPQGQ